jgi:hypothetical protein
LGALRGWRCALTALGSTMRFRSVRTDAVAHFVFRLREGLYTLRIGSCEFGGHPEKPSPGRRDGKLRPFAPWRWRGRRPGSLWKSCGEPEAVTLVAALGSHCRRRARLTPTAWDADCGASLPKTGALLRGRPSCA